MNIPEGLTELQSRGYIRDLTVDDAGKASFSFTSHRIRELLSSRVRCIVGSFMSNRIVVLLPSGDAHIAGHEDLKRLYTQLAMNVSRSMRVGVSLVSTDTDGMASLYKESLFALEETPLDGGIAFFGDGEITVTQNEVQNSVDLPSLTGKTNFLVMETDDTGKELHYLILIQADKASVSYKAAALSTELSLDGKKVKDIFDLGGGAELQARLTEYLGVEIDYYAVFDSASFVEFTGKLGTIIYPLNSDIRFSGGSSDDKYTIHFNEGEEKLSGRDISNLLKLRQSRKPFPSFC